MLRLLLLPGALFLLVILLRVVVPHFSTAPWKRLLDSARYFRQREKFEKSDRLLRKAVEKYPQRPEVYLEFFLNHSDSGNIKQRFETILEGWKLTKDRVLCFFIGSTLLEHGLHEDAASYLCRPECREYMLQKGISLLPELYLSKGEPDRAESEYENFYMDLYKGHDDFDSILPELSPKDLITLALIKREKGEDFSEIMKNAQKTSIHSNMSWRDLLSALQEKLKKMQPAAVGIDGDPAEFNRRRKEYFKKRIELIESYL